MISCLLLTQQVDGRGLADLAAVFGTGPAYPGMTRAVCERQVRDAGLHVERAEEWSGPIRFADVGTLLSYRRMVPWQLPVDFTVERYAAQLRDLERRVEPLVFTEARFLLLARGTGGPDFTGAVRRSSTYCSATRPGPGRSAGRAVVTEASPERSSARPDPHRPAARRGRVASWAHR